MDYNRMVIDLLKDYISGSEIGNRLNDAQKKLAIEIDRRKVNNEPCEEIFALYEDVLWLECDILPNKETRI